MIYSAYVAMVEEQLSVDAERRGLENFRAQQIRNSVVDLQRFIRGYRKGHTTTYQLADLVQVGCAMRGTLPDGAIPEAFWIQSTAAVTSPPCDVDAPVRNRLDFFNWNDRDYLANTPCERRLYAYCISPYSRYFVIHPALNDETELLLVWEGLKRDFADADVVPWPEDASEASAAYVKWRIILEIDKNPVLAREFFSIYSSKRLALFRDFQEKLDAEKPDEEQADDTPPSPSLAQFGSQEVPFLSTITQYVGTDTTALLAVPTTGLTTPFLVDIMIGGVMQRWALMAGGTGDQPNDYNAATNNKSWQQVS